MGLLDRLVAGKDTGVAQAMTDLGTWTRGLVGSPVTQQQFDDMARGYRDGDIEGGIKYNPEMTDWELSNHIELKKAQIHAESLNQEGFEIGDVFGFVGELGGGLINPQNIATTVLGGTLLAGAAKVSNAAKALQAARYGKSAVKQFAAEAALDVPIGVIIQKETSEAQGVEVGLVDAAGQQLAVSAGMKVLGVGAKSVYTKTRTAFMPKISESIVTPGTPLTNADEAVASATVNSGGAASVPEVLRAAKPPKFDELEVSVKKSAPVQPEKAPKFDAASIDVEESPTPANVPPQWRASHIQAGSTVLVPNNKIDKGVLRFPIGSESEKKRALRILSSSLDGFDPTNGEHVAAVIEVSNAAMTGIQENILSPTQKLPSPAPLFVKNLDNLSLGDQIQAKIDAIELNRTTPKTSPGAWASNIRSPIEEVVTQISKAEQRAKSVIPIGPTGFDAPKDAIAVEKLTTAMAEIARRMSQGKQYSSVIKKALAEIDTDDLPEGAKEKLIALNRLNELKFSPDDNGFVSGEALGIITSVLEAIDQEKIRKKVSRSATKNAQDEITRKFYRAAYQDETGLLLAKYKEDQAKYLEEVKLFKLEQKLAKKAGDEQGPTPPVAPKIDPSVKSKAALAEMRMVSNSLGPVPVAGQTGFGTEWLGKSGGESRQAIPGVDIHGALSAADRNAIGEWLKFFDETKGGPIAAMVQFFSGKNTEIDHRWHTAMSEGKSDDPNIDAAVKRWGKWWAERQPKLAKNGLVTGIIGAYSPQDLTRSHVTAGGRDAFIDFVKEHIEPDFGTPEQTAALYWDAIRSEPDPSLYGKGPTVLPSQTFRFKTPDDAWAVLQKYSDKTYAQMLQEKMHAVERYLALSEILGPDPEKMLNYFIETAAKDAREAFRDADAETKQILGSEEKINKWESEAKQVADTIWGKYQTPGMTAAGVIDLTFNPIILTAKTTGSVVYSLGDIARQQLSILNSMPGTVWNPVNYGIAVASQITNTLDEIKNWVNPFTGKKSSKGHVDSYIDYLNLSSRVARNAMTRFTMLQEGPGGTPIQQANTAALKFVSKAAHLLGNVSQISQLLPMTNHAGRIANIVELQVSLGTALKNSDGDFRSLRNGNFREHALWIKLRESGFDDESFARLHKSVNESGALVDTKISALRFKHALVDPEVLYKHDSRIGNMLNNFMHYHFEGGTASGNAYMRNLKLRGGYLGYKVGIGTQTSGTMSGTLAKAIAAMQMNMLNTASEFWKEATVNGSAQALPPIAAVIGGGIATTIIKQIMNGEYTADEIKNDPLGWLDNTTNAMRVIDDTGLLPYISQAGVELANYNATHESSIDLMGGSRQGAEGQILESFSDQFTRRPLFDFFTHAGELAQATSAGVSLLKGNAFDLPDWQRRAARVAGDLTPAPFFLRAVGIDAQKYVQDYIAPGMNEIAQGRKDIIYSTIKAESPRFSQFFSGSNNGDN